MPKSKMGRPTKEEAVHKAIAAFGGLGINRKLVRPWDIIAAIAADPAIEPSIRLRAAIALTDAPSKTTEEQYEEMRSMRREWDEADEAGRSAMVERAKADYATLVGALTAYVAPPR